MSFAPLAAVGAVAAAGGGGDPDEEDDEGEAADPPPAGPEGGPRRGRGRRPLAPSGGERLDLEHPLDRA